MGVFINRIERSELTAGDHIYSWRTLFAYSHHGIYVGGSKVVHFEQKNTVSEEPVLFSTPFKCSSASTTNMSSSKNVSASSTNVSASSTNVSSTCQIPDCGYEQKESGVILSCLDCFLDGGRLYRFEYGVSNSFFHCRIRGGTCTTAQSDPPEEVIHRAMYLLKNGYGDYDLVKNNCEDFALYCKTGLLVLDQGALGSSGQANSVVGVIYSAIASLLLKLFMSSPASLIVTTAITYLYTRYASDIGVRDDVTKVEVQELTSFRNCKSSKKFIQK